MENLIVTPIIVVIVAAAAGVLIVENVREPNVSAVLMVRPAAVLTAAAILVKATVC